MAEKVHNQFTGIHKMLYGDSKSFDLKDTVMQGTIFGELKCTVQIDGLESKAYHNDKPLYVNKNTVRVCTSS